MGSLPAALQLPCVSSIAFVAVLEPTHRRAGDGLESGRQERHVCVAQRAGLVHDAGAERRLVERQRPQCECFPRRTFRTSHRHVVPCREPARSPGERNGLPAQFEDRCVPSGRAGTSTGRDGSSPGS
jgi:hypothetical protein